MPKSCGNNNGRSAGAKRTGDLLNIRSRKVEQALTVMNKGLPEVKEAVLKSEMSINRAYKKTLQQQKQAEAECSTDNPGAKETEQAGDGKDAAVAAPVFITLEHFGALHE